MEEITEKHHSVEQVKDKMIELLIDTLLITVDDSESCFDDFNRVFNYFEEQALLELKEGEE